MLFWKKKDFGIIRSPSNLFELCGIIELRQDEPEPTKSETINGITYLYKETFWYRQFPINNEITLELCVGYGIDWIESIRPKSDLELLLDEFGGDIEITSLRFGYTDIEGVWGKFRGTSAYSKYIVTDIHGIEHDVSFLEEPVFTKLEDGRCVMSFQN